MFNIFDGVDGNSIDDIGVLIGNISNFVFALVGILAVIFIIIGGLQLATSAGNPQGLEKAKKTITNAVLGLILALSAYAISSFLLGLFGA